MSMTPDSSKYFQQVAENWDTLRSGYFTGAVRAAAVRKAYLHPSQVVADIGAGTGFMAAGLAPLVQHVHVVDGSPNMLDVARRNLAGLSNVSFHLADGLSLPFETGSLDSVFANMYLHHCPDPLAAIQEMVRVLKPGGRLVLTDMDNHPYDWFKAEMTDVWLGFERSQVRSWFEESDLVNIVVDCTGESCCTESKTTSQAVEGEVAQVSVFVASATRRVSGARQAVQAGYGAQAEGAPCGCGTSAVETSSCCGTSVQETSSCCETPPAQTSSCCGTPAADTSSCCGSEPLLMGDIPVAGVDFVTGYSPVEVDGLPAESTELALGCGNPTAMAGLQPGETVLDIGSGAGLDAFLAARRVGIAGRVIGVDMTPAMLDRARRAAEKAGLPQVEFRQGTAEELPVEAGVVDVIISNCVINLTEDKGRVFREAFRVLKPGGRLQVSDMVFSGPVPAAMRQSASSWAGCVAGALPEAEYVDLTAQAGFAQIEVKRTASAGSLDGESIYSIFLSARKPL